MAAALADRLRRRHFVHVRVGAADGVLRRYDPDTHVLHLSERLAPESRAFQLAFQIALIEGREAIEARLAEIAPSSAEASSLVRVGLLNYLAAALLMPYAPFHEAAAALRHDIEALAARFGVSFEQACQRLSSLQRSGARGVPFFFLRVDAAGNVSKRFSAAGFPFARFGGTCPRWVVHAAFGTPGAIRVQVAALPDGATFLCVARTVQARVPWGEPAPVHVVAMGCDIAHAPSVVYADGIDLGRGGHRPVLPAVRSRWLPQPRLSAA